MTNALRVFNTAPSTDDYTSLQAHQEQTPDSFFGGKPVLHHHVAASSLKLSEQALSNNAALSVLHAPDATSSSAPVTSNGDSTETRLPEITVNAIDIWVTSEFFCLWSTATNKGIQIPYPTISLHARQQTSLYLQLCLDDLAQTADEDLETIEMLLTPSTLDQASADQLYAAVSACADLHPDPNDDGDDDDDQEQEQLPEPGAGGWITSENMADFMDENGEFRMPQGALGAGAGSVRTAGQFDDADAGDEADGDESKWRRTE